ncbi:competence type IV pilus minor pilin ComGF [uncultured Rossellomorea sp.]|uniref:competence type IV pilus minor pilin ComGF n=1 Tax=uncultured Rossellomorea sp. TaxID=2837549 RepID=UPI0026043FB3|nr:competence type IV pilus minor pilin ComGF [uncultured Rossellomorea sp.]
MKKRVFIIKKEISGLMKYVSPWVNNKGYTLIESLLSFTIFCMISLCIPLIMNGFSTIKNDLVPPHYYEWNLFNESLRYELWRGESVEITPDKISFMVNGESISYEKYNQSLRRRVNNRGHEVVLQAVDSFSFASIIQGVHLDLEFVGGERVEGEFFYFSTQQGEGMP